MEVFLFYNFHYFIFNIHFELYFKEKWTFKKLS